jgi:hypothetical protein
MTAISSSANGSMWDLPILECLYGRWSEGREHFGADVRMRVDLLDWADRYDLRSGSTACSSGLHWLDKGRCTKRECHDRPEFYDHTTTWLSRTTGKPVLVLNQPYRPVDPADMCELIREYPPLTSEVGPASWYGSGTYGVYVWNHGNRADVGRPHPCPRITGATNGSG